MLKEFFAKDDGKLGDILKDEAGIGYFSLQKILRKKDVKINGQRVSSDSAVKKGDKISVYYDKKEGGIYDKFSKTKIFWSSINT